jgi:hypothetical protein
MNNADELLAIIQAEVNRWITEQVAIERNIDVSELFCGAGGISDAFEKLGKRARRFDRHLGESVYVRLLGL